MLNPDLLEIAPPGPAVGVVGPPPDLPLGEQLLYYWWPARPLDLVHQHLHLALRAIAAKRARIDQRWDYYLGRHSEKVLSEKLRAVMLRQSEMVASMFTNYCSLAVETPLERLRVVGWKGDEAQVSAATDLWNDNDLDAEQEEIHKAAIVAGECYVIVWPAADPDTGEPLEGEDGPEYDVALQDARNMYIHFGSRKRRDRRWAAKVWLDQDVDTGQMRWRANMFYTDELIRLVYPTPAQAMTMCPQDPAAFVLDEEDRGGPHPFGAVPVIRFARAWDSRSVLDAVTPVQDRVNKLTADRLVTGEFAAFPQRWALTNDEPPPEALRAGPGSVWVIPPASTSPDGNEDAKTQVGQFPAASLSNYDGTIQDEVSTLFTLGKLPRHLLINPGVAPSGEAIKADEAPMIASVRAYVRLFAASWREVMKLCGVDVHPVWQDVEVRNELTSAQTMQALATAGLPLRLAAELALDLDEDALKELDNLPVPPQPGAGVPGQAARPAAPGGDGGMRQGDMQQAMGRGA